MSHFAKVVNGIVTEVHVAEADVLALGYWGDPSLFVQTSYNTRGGVHVLGGTPLRGNYAGIGYIYDSVNDVFYPPQPYPSWTINTTTWTWEPPTPMPTDEKVYSWDEATLSWLEYIPPVEPTPIAPLP